MSATTLRTLAAAASLAFALLGHAPAAATGGDYPPQECLLSISDPQPAPGETFTVTATSNDEGGTIWFEFNGETKSATVSGGSATVAFSGPAPGTYTGIVTCDDKTVEFVINRAPPVTPPTGSDSTRSGLLIGTGLVGLGAAMTAVAHRRRRETIGPPQPTTV